MTQHLRRRDPTNVGWSKARRGPTGRPVCRWCLGECLGRRRTFCRQECVRDWQVAAGQHLWHVHQRDRGVCQSCGLDCDRLARVLRTGLQVLGGRGLLPDLPGDGRYSLFAVHHSAALAALGFPPVNTVRSLWDADHIRPLVEGGVNSLNNLRTLCLPCHRAETRALAGRLAARRRQEVA